LIKNIKIEIKFFIFLIIVVVISLTMINFIFINTFKSAAEENLRKEITLYQKLITKNIDVSIPHYLEITNSSLKKNGYTLFEIDKQSYFYVKSDYIKNLLKDKISLLLYWDIIIILSIALLYFLTIYRVIDREKAYLKNFEIIFLVFSHKLRNYLTSAKVNLEMIKKGKSEVADRLIFSNSLLESDLNSLFNFVNKIDVNYTKREKINVKDLVFKLIKELKLSEIFSLRYNINNFYITGFYNDIYQSFYLLFDNIRQHACKNLYIRAGSFRNKNYIILKNDIREDTNAGLRVGLSVAEKLLEKNKTSIKWKKDKKYFIVKIKF